MSNFKDYNVFTYREILSGVAYCEHPETKLIELSVAEAKVQGLEVENRELKSILYGSYNSFNDFVNTIKANAIEEMRKARNGICRLGDTVSIKQQEAQFELDWIAKLREGEDD